MSIQRELLSVPCPGYLPFDRFEALYSSHVYSTEESHPLTQEFSQTVEKCVEKGLDLLLQVEKDSVVNFDEKQDLKVQVATQIARGLQQEGRLFFVGCGTSGRMAVTLAASVQNLDQDEDESEEPFAVHGIIAGGDGAMIVAQEGVEDSESLGKEAAAELELSARDTIILISASGSPAYNVGFGQQALKAKSSVYYFYNNQKIPERTAQLFADGVQPLYFPCKPQAISGSTRLQAANLALLHLGEVLNHSLRFLGESLSEVNFSSKINEVLAICEDKKTQIAEIATKIHKCTGYITFITDEDAFREVLTDVVELTPTFSIPPVRSVDEENKQPAPFRAFLCKDKNEQQAWELLVSRKVNDAAAYRFELTDSSKTYTKRSADYEDLMIAVGKEGLSVRTHSTLQFSEGDQGIIETREINEDLLGIFATYQLKVLMNMLSNSVMALKGYVMGNRMINVIPSNYKLINRSVNLIEELAEKRIPREQIYNGVCHAYEAFKKSQKEGNFSLPVVKIVLEVLKG